MPKLKTRKAVKKRFKITATGKVRVASSLRRGLLDETEADRYEKPAANIASGFTISGLGQLIDACIESDRVMTFGA